MRLKPPSKLEQARIYQKVRMVIFQPEFQRQVDEIRKDFKIEFWKNSRQLFHVTSKKFDSKVNTIRENYKLHRGWFGTIKQYILNNTLLDDPDAPVLTYISTAKIGSIEIFPNTELWDIKNAMMLFGTKVQKKRFKPWVNMDRDHDIYELARTGKTIAEVHRIIQKKYKQDMGYGAIKTALSKFQKRMNIPVQDKVKDFKTR